MLVGIVEPVDPEERYWFQVGGLYYERLDAVRNDAGLWVISLFLPEQTLVDRIGAETPSLLGNVTDTLYVNPDRLLDMGLADADTALVNLQGRLTADASRSIFISLLGNSLPEFRDEVARNQMPLVIVLVIVGAILLYSLTMIAFTVGRTTEGIVGLLRSRGAGGRRTVTLILAWALGAIIISAILAPLIAWGAIRGLGELGAWRVALDGASLMPSPIIPVLPWLAAGIAITIAIMAVPVIGVSRVPVSTLQSERSRPTNLPWFRPPAFGHRSPCDRRGHPLANGTSRSRGRSRCRPNGRHRTVGSHGAHRSDCDDTCSPPAPLPPLAVRHTPCCRHRASYWKAAD